MAVGMVPSAEDLGMEPRTGSPGNLLQVISSTASGDVGYGMARNMARRVGRATLLGGGHGMDGAAPPVAAPLTRGSLAGGGRVAGLTSRGAGGAC